MSLEDALNRNNELLAQNNELLSRLVNKAQAVAEGEEAAKPKATRTKAADKAAEKADSAKEAPTHTVESVKPRVGAWLTEFPKDDPESKRRGEALQAALAKIGEKSISTITDQTNIDRVAAWIEKRVAEGRVAPEWKPEAPAAAEDDDI